MNMHLITRLLNNDKRRIRLSPPDLPEGNYSVIPEVSMLLFYGVKFRLTH